MLSEKYENYNTVLHTPGFYLRGRCIVIFYKPKKTERFKRPVFCFELQITCAVRKGP